MSEERAPLVHVAIRCGNVIEEIDKIIYIGNVSEVTCDVCNAKIAELNAKRDRERAATALKATNEARDALGIAARGEDAPGYPRVDWTQVARDALTEALDALAVKS